MQKHANRNYFQLHLTIHKTSDNNTRFLFLCSIAQRMFSKQSILKIGSLLNYDQDTICVYFETSPQYLTDGYNFFVLLHGPAAKLYVLPENIKTCRKAFSWFKAGRNYSNAIQGHSALERQLNILLQPSNSTIISSTHKHTYAVNLGEHDKLLHIQPWSGQDSFSEQACVKFIDEHKVNENNQLILICI